MQVVVDALQTLAGDCLLQTEVERCLNSVLLDVETTYHLTQELQLQANQQTMEKLIKEHKATVWEADAERRVREFEKGNLADQLVTELMVLSRELDSLRQWKKQQEHKVEHYDDIVAKLAQTEEELAVAQRVSYGGDPKPRPLVVVPEKEASAWKTTTTTSEKDGSLVSIEESASTTDVSETTTEIKQAMMQQSMEDHKKKDETKKPAAAKADDSKQLPAAETIVVDIPPPATVAEIIHTPIVTSSVTTETTEGNNADDEPPQNDATTVEPAAAVVVLLDHDEQSEEKVPGLVEMDNIEILMNVFGFLDAIDILNTAQINISMYSRIDTIFGISEDGQTPPVPPPIRRPTPVTKQQPEAKQQPQVVVVAETTTRAVADSKPAAAAAAAAAEFSGPLGLFSMLQPRATTTTGAPFAGKRAETSSGRGPTTTMNPSVAESMASKLSDAELAAIISMTDKLSKLDKEVSLLRNEKEALTQKLDGTEAVKQFLIGKVRDVEVKLNQSKEDEVKVTQQIASDQEVIAFLDSRVQELERTSDNGKKEKDTVQTELESLKVTSSKKITMLSDILKYEREKLKDEETEWKATKKVLVKEVKACRAQILALQAERDGYKEQNEMLKRAIVSTGKSATASPSRIKT